MEDRWLRVVSETPYAWGLVSLILLDILFLFSLAWIRQKCYNLFILTHFIASIVFLAAASPFLLPFSPTLILRCVSGRFVYTCPRPFHT